jgi:hypothetical protein
MVQGPRFELDSYRLQRYAMTTLAHLAIFFCILLSQQLLFFYSDAVPSQLSWQINDFGVTGGIRTHKNPRSQLGMSTNSITATPKSSNYKITHLMLIRHLQELNLPPRSTNRAVSNDPFTWAGVLCSNLFTATRYHEIE